MLPPFFNPGPIEHPQVPIYLAVVNTYMAALAGELCQGLRLHPIASFAYAREVVLPAVEKGARRVERPVTDIDFVGAPFIATGANWQAVDKAREALRQQISFYAATRSYHAVLAHHGWEAVGMQLHALSLKGKWSEMPKLITDEMLSQWAVIAPYEQLAEEINKTADGLFTTVLLDLPADLRSDQQRLKALLADLHS